MQYVLMLFVFTVCSMVNVPSALALRPFVTTDADVAGPYEIELEWGVFGFTVEKQPGRDEVRIQSPNLRLNVGFPGDWEIVLETVYEFIDKKNTGGFSSDTSQFTDTGGFFKKVWYRGSGWWPNFATETGILYPTERGAERARDIDFEGLVIFTWNFPGLTWHMTLGGATKHTDEIDEPNENKANFIFGTIVDVPVPGRERFHLVGEYSGEKAEKEAIEHQLLGGMVWHSPWDMDFDVAGFGGLSAESIDWGVTTGVTISTNLTRRRRREVK